MCPTRPSPSGDPAPVVRDRDNETEPTDDSIARGLFFIVGTGRCGSTLLQAMLARHPRLSIPQETHFFGRMDPRVIVGGDLDSPIRVRRYVRRVMAHHRWHEFGISESELTGAIEGGAKDTRGLFLWLVRRLTGEEATRIGEKTPRHASRVGRISELFPEAKFIHIHRDPRDVVLSMKDRAWSVSLYHSAKRCRDVYDTVSRRASELGDEWVMALGYEDLVRDPEMELRRVCAFLGETFDEAMLEHERGGDGLFTDREEAWKSRTRRPIDSSRIGRYLDGLTMHELRVVEHVVGEHLERLGYERSGAGQLGAVGLARLWVSRAVGFVRWFAREVSRKARTLGR